MIHVKANVEGLVVNQTITSPSVYLDHWALRGISESEHLSARLVKALKDRDGTLVLSWLNVVEFCKVSDTTQTRKADALLNELALNVFWLDPDFFTVIERESKQGEVINDLPASDMPMLRGYVTAVYRKTVSLQALNAPSFFSDIQKATQIPRQYEAVADLIISQLTRLRTEFVAGSVLASAFAKKPNKAAERGTRMIARGFMHRILKDKCFKLNRNNAIDMTHAVVSVSYCDFVLLDTLWTTMVNEMRQTFSKADTRIRLAKAFSKRANGIESFLAEFESLPLP